MRVTGNSGIFFAVITVKAVSNKILNLILGKGDFRR